MTAVLPGARAGVPQRRPATRPGRHLRPVERPGTRRSPAIPALVGVGMVIAALLALAVMHALLIGGQVRLDGMRREVAAETESIRRLELRVAELESPDRVLEVARERIGMVQPSEVGYLLPVGVPGAPAEPVRVPAAEAPAPEPVAPSSATSAEQAEVDRAVADPDPDADADPDAEATPDADVEAEATSDAVDDESAATGPSEGGRDE
jgi:hypothetical protein